MSDNPKEAEKEMEKAIFISADCWLEVFGLLPRSQLGFGIAMISRRFDYYVDEHFKTRKWTLEKEIRIRGVIGDNGVRSMEIINSSNLESLPIPQNPLPNKFIGFRSIKITFFDDNVLTFLRRFHRFFDTFKTKFYIGTGIQDVRIMKFAVFTIWPMFKDTIRVISFNTTVFRQMRQLAPSILNNCPALRIVIFSDGILPEFPPDDSANASDGRAVAKWLFSPRPDNLWKVLSTQKNPAGCQWPSTVEQIKAAFSSASSPVSFVISAHFLSSSSLSSVVPFELTNQLTGEKLALSQKNAKAFMLIRCPIGEGIEDEKIQEFFDGGRKNTMEINIVKGGVDEGILDDLPGPSGDH